MRRWTWSAIAIAIMACGSSTGPAQPNIEGTWTLVRANGAALPYNNGVYVLDDATAQLVAPGVAGAITSHLDGTARFDNVRVLGPPPLELEWQDYHTGPDPVVVRGDTLTITTARWTTGVPIVCVFVRAH